jgi:hypothetical protein
LITQSFFDQKKDLMQKIQILKATGCQNIDTSPLNYTLIKLLMIKRGEDLENNIDKDDISDF